MSRSLTLLGTLALAGCGGVDTDGFSSGEVEIDSTGQELRTADSLDTVADAPPTKVLTARPIGTIDPLPTVLPPPPPPPQTLEQIASSFTNHDINGDGVAEIESLTFLSGDENNANAPNGLALVLYDPRLVTDDSNVGISGLQVRLQLALLRSDMWNAGYNPRFIQAKVYRGPDQQDGRTVLALRRFLQAVRAAHPLRTVTLIGDFPESRVVRQVLVRSHQGSDAKRFGTVELSNVDYVATGTELVAPRTDLVLSDLDGNWEALYVKNPTTFRDVELVPDLPAGTNFPAAGQTLTGSRYNVTAQSFRDCFVVNDRQATFIESNGVASLAVQSLTEPNPEVSSADRSLANPIARPEIEVSRINPRHVGLVPFMYGTSTDGKGLLGSDGKPRTVRLTGTGSVDWREDPTQERRILTDYLYRNHAFRLGGDRNKPYRTSAVRARESNLISPASFNNTLRKADSSFGPSLAVDEADMSEYINWLKEPAVLRGIAAHSDQVSSVFAESNAWLVDAMVGGKPWNWTLKSDSTGYYLEPSIGTRKSADFFLYRTLWENRIYDTMSTGQAFYMHDGCTVNGVPSMQPYSANLFAARQHAESMLFYANGLGMLARAKVFNDTPRNFTETIASTKRFAAGLKGYFQADATDGSLNPSKTTDWANRRTRTLQRKRTYFWGLLGDPTLLIRY